METPLPGTPSGASPDRLDERQAAVAGQSELGPPLESAEQGGDGSTGTSRRSLFTNLSDGDQLALFAGDAVMLLDVSKFGLLNRALRFIELNWQPSTGSPREDVERAFGRVETVLGDRYRDRRDGETRRAYIEAVQRTSQQASELG